MASLPICTHCGTTWGEVRARGLLGCPHCYAAFGESLRTELLWVHQALEPLVPDERDPAARAERIAHLREELADALRREDYAAAARSRRALDAEGDRDAAAGAGG